MPPASCRGRRVEDVLEVAALRGAEEVVAVVVLSVPLRLDGAVEAVDDGTVSGHGGELPGGRQAAVRAALALDAVADREQLDASGLDRVGLGGAIGARRPGLPVAHIVLAVVVLRLAVGLEDDPLLEARVVADPAVVGEVLPAPVERRGQVGADLRDVEAADGVDDVGAGTRVVVRVDVGLVVVHRRAVVVEAGELDRDPLVEIGRVGRSVGVGRHRGRRGARSAGWPSGCCSCRCSHCDRRCCRRSPGRRGPISHRRPRRDGAGAGRRRARSAGSG